MGPLDPAQAEERADRAVRHMAIELDATAEQQGKLRTIAKDAVKDLLPMRDKARAARERARELLTQPTVDRAAIEAFRVEQMALAEAASKRIAKSLGDAAEVLTPTAARGQLVRAMAPEPLATLASRLTLGAAAGNPRDVSRETSLRPTPARVPLPLAGRVAWRALHPQPGGVSRGQDDSDLPPPLPAKGRGADRL